MSTCEDKYMATIVHFEIPSDNIERSKSTSGQSQPVAMLIFFYQYEKR
jgi:hypothetical protein